MSTCGREARCRSERTAPSPAGWDLLAGAAAQAERINLDPQQLDRGLMQLVLSVVELLRRLMERQALRRIEGGGLTGEQVERLGLTLMRLEERMDQLKRHFQIDDLNIDLGPLGNLLD